MTRITTVQADAEIAPVSTVAKVCMHHACSSVQKQLIELRNGILGWNLGSQTTPWMEGIHHHLLLYSLHDNQRM